MSTTDEIAKALPNDLFKDDPEIVRLTEFHDRAQKRLALMKSGNAERNHLAEKVKKVGYVVDNKIHQANNKLFIAALNDIAAGDFEFSSAMDLLAYINEQEDLKRIAAIAAQLGQNPPPALLADMVEQDATYARHRLGEALLERKRAYLSEHPDALAA